MNTIFDLKHLSIFLQKGTLIIKIWECMATIWKIFITYRIFNVQKGRRKFRE